MYAASAHLIFISLNHIALLFVYFFHMIFSSKFSELKRRREKYEREGVKNGRERGRERGWEGETDS